MIGAILRTLWRVIIFGLGITVVWFLLFKIRPYADSYLPTFVVVLLLYCFIAYFVIPALIRLLRLLIKPDHIPLYVTTRDGWPSDPVILAVIAHNKQHLRKKMRAAGWYESDPLTFKNGLYEFISIVFNRAYPEAPVSNLYLFNRHQDISFQIPTNGRLSARTRHHIRFWKLEEPPLTQNDHGHFSFWATRLKKFVGAKRSIWIGAGTEEPHPIDIQWRTGQFTHGGSHDANAERDFIIQTLKASAAVKKISTSRRGEKTSFRGQQFRTIYTTDGSLKVIELNK